MNIRSLLVLILFSAFQIAKSQEIRYRNSIEDFSYMFLYPEDRNNPIMRKAANNNGSCESEHECGTYYECENQTYSPVPDSLRFKGNVYILTNYLVYSAGNTFAGLIKDYKTGKIWINRMMYTSHSFTTQNHQTL